MSVPPFCPLGNNYYLEDGTLSPSFWTNVTGNTELINSADNFFYLNYLSFPYKNYSLIKNDLGATQTVSFLAKASKTGSAGGAQALSIQIASFSGSYSYELQLNISSAVNQFGYSYSLGGGSYSSFVDLFGAHSIGDTLYFEVKIIRDAINVSLYIENVLIASQPNYAPTDKRLIIQSSTGNNHLMGVQNLYILSPSMPNTCLGTIPTHHEVAPDSTVKMSHVRRIRGERTATAAQAAAEAMRARFL